MTGGWGRAIAAGVACAATLVIPDRTADAQVAEEEDVEVQVSDGFLVTGDVTFGVEVDSNGLLATNPTDVDTVVFSDFRVGLLSETQSARLTFDIGGRVQYESAAGDDDNGFIDPFVEFGYTGQGPDSRLAFSTSYRESDVVDTLFIDLDGDLLADSILTAEGEVETFRAVLDYRFLQTAPIGGEVLLSYRDRNFTNTVSDELFDTEVLFGRLTMNVRPRQTLDFRLFAEQEEYEADDVEETDRTTFAYGVGVNYEISPIWLFDGEIRATEVETVTTAGETENDGVGLEFTLTRAMPNGDIGLFGSREISSEVTRSQIGVFRNLEIPGAELGFSIAISDSDVGETVWLAGLDYTREMPSGVITASLTQVALANEDEEEVLRTTLDAAYLHELTPSSAVTVGLALGRTEDIGVGDVPEGTRADLTVTYSQELTPEWDWSVSYRGRYSHTRGGTTATSNAIIGTIGRSFSLRP